MAQKIQIRRGLSSQRINIIPDSGELCYDTDTGELYMGDASTMGGNLIAHIDPYMLLNNLNLNGFSIQNATGIRNENDILFASGIDKDDIHTQDNAYLFALNATTNTIRFQKSTEGIGNTATWTSLLDIQEDGSLMSPNTQLTTDTNGSLITTLGDLTITDISADNSKSTLRIKGNGSGPSELEIRDGDYSTSNVSFLVDDQTLSIVFGSGMNPIASAIWNSTFEDVDFEIKKNTTGTAYRYDAGADNHEFDGGLSVISSHTKPITLTTTREVGGSIPENILTLRATTTSSSIDGFGARIVFQIKDSTNVTRNQGFIDSFRINHADDYGGIRIVSIAGGFSRNHVEFEPINGAIFNPTNALLDFQIKKNTTGAAYVYDATLDSHRFSGDMGFFDTTPVPQQAKINEPAGGTVIDTEARAAINDIVDVLESFGLTQSA